MEDHPKRESKTVKLQILESTTAYMRGDPRAFEGLTPCMHASMKSFQCVFLFFLPLWLIILSQNQTPLGSPTRPILPPLTPRPKNAELAAIQPNISSPVPIIAPPSDHGPTLPLSPEAVSKIRIIRLLEREVSGRKADGLSPGICERPPHWMVPESGDVNPSDIDNHSSIKDDIRFEWEVVMGLGSKRRRSIVDWLLHV